MKKQSTILFIILMAMILSGCALFDARTGVYRAGSDSPDLEIRHPQYSEATYTKSADGTESLKVNSKAAKGLASTLIEGATLGMTNQMINPNND